MRLTIAARWFLLFGLFVVALLCFGYPMYVIRPFRAQGASELARALTVKSWGPGLAVLCSLVSLTIVLMSWTRSRWIGRTFSIVLTLLTVAFTGLSMVNVYEKMFHPVDRPAFIAADQAKVDNDDMVLAVNIGPDSRAYPIRIMGYHHIVNDIVGRKPIVSTY